MEDDNRLAGGRAYTQRGRNATDWRQYISAELRAVWPTLNSEQKWAIAQNAARIPRYAAPALVSKIRAELDEQAGVTPCHAKASSAWQPARSARFTTLNHEEHFSNGPFIGSNRCLRNCTGTGTRGLADPSRDIAGLAAVREGPFRMADRCRTHWR